MVKNEKGVEIWKVHPEFNFIEVSNLGRVRTTDRVVLNGAKTHVVKGRILKQYPINSGYFKVCFRVNGKVVNRNVHRLVAGVFIPNPKNLPQVNHKDCDRANNCADNLEWCDNSYNVRYREKYGVSQTESLGHPVFAIDLTTLKVSNFRSQREAGRWLGINNKNINSVLRGKQKTTGGYWFVEDNGDAVKNIKSKLHDIGGVGLKL